MSILTLFIGHYRTLYDITSVDLKIFNEIFINFIKCIFGSLCNKRSLRYRVRLLNKKKRIYANQTYIRLFIKIKLKLNLFLILQLFRFVKIIIIINIVPRYIGSKNYYE